MDVDKATRSELACIENETSPVVEVGLKYYVFEFVEWLFDGNLISSSHALPVRRHKIVIIVLTVVRSMNESAHNCTSMQNR